MAGGDEGAGCGEMAIPHRIFLNFQVKMQAFGYLVDKSSLPDGTTSINLRQKESSRWPPSPTETGGLVCIGNANQKNKKRTYMDNSSSYFHNFAALQSIIL